MIPNAHTLLGVFLALTAGMLGLWLAGIAARLLTLRGVARDRPPDDRAVRLAHLMDLVVLALGVIGMLAWPHLYALLASYVPDLALSGVMCAYGVTRVSPRTVPLLQVLIPATLWCIGLCVLLARVDRQAPAAPLWRRRAAVAFLAAAVALAASATELAYVFQNKGETRVTCCTQFLGTGVTRLPSASPLAKWGVTGTHAATLAVYFAVNAVVIIVTLALAAPGGWPRVGFALRLVVLPLVAASNLLVTHAAWLESVAPLVLKLPYHHCIYELLTDTLAMGLAAMCAVIGNAGLLWVPALELAGRPALGEARAAGRAVGRFCAVMLATHLVIVAIHLV